MPRLIQWYTEGTIVVKMHTWALNAVSDTRWTMMNDASGALCAQTKFNSVLETLLSFSLFGYNDSQLRVPCTMNMTQNKYTHSYAIPVGSHYLY